MTLSFARENRIASWHFIIAFVALAIGLLFGPLQVWEHTGIKELNFYPYLRAIGIQSYYQGLTLHGVLNALVFTTFFITGFLTFATVRSLQKPLTIPALSWAALIIMVVGLLMAAVPILLNQATVLFTFYPPLKANPFFYIGLTLVVVGSWVTGWSLFATYLAWRKENPGVQTPLIALGSLITMALWQLCTLGVAVEMLTMLIPWSLGLIPGLDPLLARTFFWFTGHPLVYFWLLPAYISWYGMVPKMAGGKLFSEPLARLAFWLFLLISTPLGFHHQYVDPGIPAIWKYIHAGLTFAVFFPSMLTAFNVMASLEIGGRARGGTGLFGWIFRLPWNEPSFAAQTLAMIIFAFGGISGLTNASYNLNLVTHNTMWVPGHFHMTVGTAVALTFMALMYWMLPMLTGKPLRWPKLALAQGWTWFIGMALMANGMHILGLRYELPRRSLIGALPYFNPEWTPFLIESAIGGTILLISSILFFTVMIGTLVSKERLATAVEMPVAEAYEPGPAPKWLDSWRPWLAGALALVVVGYGPMMVQLIAQSQWNVPGPAGRLW
ncbi:MAG: b(o/a)3-type cytochrome-c oxidase subunit 1 [Anaerolineales bacterium]|nr:b(o/a)3-type cytochrome-c oxidase subunit 1 [Anaerolineales bacterium]